MNTPRISEGTLSAQRITGLNFPAIDPDYFDHQLRQHRPPLRVVTRAGLIPRPADEPSPLERVDKRAPTRAPMPRVSHNPLSRRITWALLVMWCVGWLVWAAWFIGWR